jgi:hypothetical protein
MNCRMMTHSWMARADIKAQVNARQTWLKSGMQSYESRIAEARMQNVKRQYYQAGHFDILHSTFDILRLISTFVKPIKCKRK